MHYYVANVPGAVPHTSTYALTNDTMAYALAIADKGFQTARQEDELLARGVNIAEDQVVHGVIVAVHWLPHARLASVV